MGIRITIISLKEETMNSQVLPCLVTVPIPNLFLIK